MSEFHIFINALSCRDLLVSFRKATGQKPLRIIFYRSKLLSVMQFYLQFFRSYSLSNIASEF